MMLTPRSSELSPCPDLLRSCGRTTGPLSSKQLRILGAGFKGESEPRLALAEEDRVQQEEKGRGEEGRG